MGDADDTMAFQRVIRGDVQAMQSLLFDAEVFKGRIQIMQLAGLSVSALRPDMRVLEGKALRVADAIWNTRAEFWRHIGGQQYRESLLINEVVEELYRLSRYIKDLFPEESSALVSLTAAIGCNLSM